MDTARGSMSDDADSVDRLIEGLDEDLRAAEAEAGIAGDGQHSDTDPDTTISTHTAQSDDQGAWDTGHMSGAESPPLLPPWDEGGDHDHHRHGGGDQDDDGGGNRGGHSGRRRGHRAESGMRLRPIGHEAVWSVSSAKPGCGVRMLRDGRADTYWQSEGSQPHLINIAFHRRTAVAEVRILLDYVQDESYTPTTISVRYGSNVHDLREAHLMQLNEPQGWVTAAFQGRQQEDGSKARIVIRARMLQLAVLANHQNGRDSHIRQIEVFGPAAAAAGEGTGIEEEGQAGRDRMLRVDSMPHSRYLDRRLAGGMLMSGLTGSIMPMR